MMGWVVVGCVLVLALLVIWSCCALAGELDDQDERLFGIRRS
jgi:hypothetical protein